MALTIVCISDTHGMHDRIALPDGDILIHSGDCLGHGTLDEVAELNEWLAAQPHRHKVLIAGNHDWCFQAQPELARQRLTAATYLQDELTEIEGLKIWGSPWTPLFRDWAFNLERGDPLRQKWAEIPADIDILVTHGPPAGILDEVVIDGEATSVGCRDLKDAITRTSPRLHVFGHIHEGYGQVSSDGCRYINASTNNHYFQPVNSPVVIEV